VETFLSFTIIGLSTAAIYAVGASGLVLTYTTTGIFNFAHGAIGMIGAFAYWEVRFDRGWPAPLALLFVLGVLMPLLGVLLELVIMRRLQGVSDATRLVVSVSLLVGFIGVANWRWDPNVGRSFPVFFQGERTDFWGAFPINVTYHELTTVAVAVAVALYLRFLLYRTRAGVSMRATVDDRPLAMLTGARPGLIAMMAWATGCSLAALSGILIAPTLALNASTLSLLIVNAYAAAMIGRLRSLPMTFLGAVILGLLESYAIGYLPRWFPDNRYIQGIRPAIPVIVLFVVLLVLPHARLRGHTAARAREFFPKPTMALALWGAVALIATATAITALMTRSDMLTGAKVFALGIIALSFVPLVGYAGQISLAQLTFAGVGAITMAHLGDGGSVGGVLAAAVVCGALGALVALPALRLTGIYLALATAAFAVAMDRWVFSLPALDVFGLFEVKFFEGGSVPVDRLDVLGVSTQSPRAQMILLATVFSVLGLFVVWLRRSRFGYRLVAMKDSEAACATLGLNLTGTKLAVFAISGAIAGVGGALYGGLLGSINPERFSFIEGLPLFMLTVVGGIGAVGGALFAGIGLAFFPLIPKIAPEWFTDVIPLRSLVLVLPATLGIGLGLNPSGIVRDLGRRWSPIVRQRPVLVGLVGTEIVIYALALLDLYRGWWWVLFSLVALVAAPPIAESIEARSAVVADLVAEDVEPEDVPYELVGIVRPWSEADRDRLDELLGVSEAELRGAT
jgi:branched-chain amino acid transport system permease protein